MMAKHKRAAEMDRECQGEGGVLQFQTEQSGKASFGKWYLSKDLRS